MTRASLVRDIRRRWPAIVAKARTLPSILPASLHILGTSRKIEKTREAFSDILPAITYLAPAHEAFADGAEDGRTLCPWATTCVGP